MFGYRFTDNESILNNQKNVQLIDVIAPIANKKSKRINFVKSYNKLSIFRFVLTNSFSFMSIFEKQNLE